MATPASVFRPSTPKAITVSAEGLRGPELDPEIAAVIVDIPPPPTGDVAPYLTSVVSTSSGRHQFRPAGTSISPVARNCGWDRPTAGAR